MGLPPAIVAGIGSAIPSLLGGLFGGSSKPQQQEINFKKLRDNALAAGFNPVTALRATGGQGFGVTPGISSAEFVANALGEGVRGALGYDPLARRREELEVDILQAELDQYKQRGSAYPGDAQGFPNPPQVPTAFDLAFDDPLLPATGSNGQSELDAMRRAEIERLRILEDAKKRVYTDDPSPAPTAGHVEETEGDVTSTFYSAARLVGQTLELLDERARKNRQQDPLGDKTAPAPLDHFGLPTAEESGFVNSSGPYPEQDTHERSGGYPLGYEYTNEYGKRFRWGRVGGRWDFYEIN